MEKQSWIIRKKKSEDSYGLVSVSPLNTHAVMKLCVQ